MWIIRFFQNDVFVTADAGDHVLGVAEPPQHSGRRDQQAVSGVVAKRIIDRFEPVEIDIEYRKGRAALSEIRQPGLELDLEMAAVREAGQRVLVGVFGPRLGQPGEPLVFLFQPQDLGGCFGQEIRRCRRDWIGGGGRRRPAGPVR